MKNFIIFANARTGSTSLMHVLEGSPDGQMLHEPFHPRHNTWPGYANRPNYSESIKTTEDLDKALDEIFSEYNSFKTLQYQLDQDIYNHLLKKKDINFIFLYRENKAKAALSGLIAQQSSVWQMKDFSKDKFKKLDNISIEEMHKKVDYLIEMNEVFLETLEETNHGNYLEISYEELYEVDSNSQLRKIHDICQFLEIDEPAKAIIEKYFVPKDNKISKNIDYTKIPNWTELINEFPELKN